MSFSVLHDNDQQNENNIAVSQIEEDTDHVTLRNQFNRDDGLRRRSVRSSLSSGGVKSASPADDSLFAVQDDDSFSVFAKGRDYEPIFITHQYTEQEKETLGSYESCDYLPSHSHIYKHWIKRQMISNIETDRWVMMGLIGFTVGLLGFVLHQLIERISSLKWSTTKKFLDDGQVAVAWMFCSAYSMAFAIFAAVVIVFWRPSAGGSGLPEVTGFLNGTQVKKIFSVKTLTAKFLSCVSAIGCGMPIGPEGPMIHMGAIVGAGLSQGTSVTLNLKLPFFERFRNPEDRRNFISAGVAAGVSAAFGAPVGGLLFCMEEVSSFWSNTLSWQIFFCCIIATSTSDLFNSSFESFERVGTFGGFRTSRYILFNVYDAVDINILMFIPSVILGVIGGLLGSLFTILNLKLVMSSFSVFLPMAFKCIPYTCIPSDTNSISDFCVNDTANKYDSHLREAEESFHTCEEGTQYTEGTTLFNNGTYNELALLLFSSKDEAMKNLYLRNSHRMFNYGPLFVGLIIYFFMVIWSAGTSVAAGILVPMLVIGALYGRILGLVIVDMFGIHLGESYWSWMDPGAFALIGSASFFSGVARLAPAITSIMMELTNDLKVLLPVMSAVVVAKWVGDYLTHPFFHALLELKCIPFLNQQPNVRIKKQNVKLELFTASDIMAFPVVTLNLVEHVPNLAQKLLDHTHNGFPVLKESPSGDLVFCGLITRSELLVILENKDVLKPGPLEPLEDRDLDIAPIGYDAMLRGPVEREQMTKKFLQQFVDRDSFYRDHYIDLTAYMNQSAMSVPCRFSLHRAYTLLTALGLRHLTVVDECNQVKGIITRKDLMGFHMVETLGHIMQTRPYFSSPEEDEVATFPNDRPNKSIQDGDQDDEENGNDTASNNVRGRVNPLGIADVELNIVTEEANC
ncbi:chloride channel protein [Plakobranchus ocellatus]|uniref:Chloride channel protein n=1 Tax=Plakobranchus ocellatus TaxID=259542 RepID=A0AAV4B783_9GAST|nr:chloride channel protein [Plakobranchus ocellatus]